jgi:GWxTD domain-containing protein
MKSAVIKHLAFIVLSAAFFSGCRSTKLSNKNVADKYYSARLQLNPQYMLHHLAADTSVLYMRLPLKDVLFKKDEGNSFASKLYLIVNAYPDFTTKTIIDSASFIFSPEYRQDSTVVLYKNFQLRLRAQKGVLQFALRDLNRNVLKEDFLLFDKSNQSPQTFFVTDNNAGLPFFGTHVTTAAHVSVTGNEGSKNLYLRYFNRDFPVAKPPFVMADENKFSYTSSISKVVPDEELKNFSAPRPGIYHFQYDSTLLKGLTLFYFDDDFPLVTNATQLIEGLRYITSNKEYDKLKTASDKKDAVDNFWVEASGSRERARRLLLEYYSRMQDANRFFTSYLQGWKTDRGMIYLVFGKPQVVYVSDEKEYWEYAYTPGYGNLSFTFKRLSNPFTDNDFELERQQSYEPVWYMAVDRWRQGRIDTRD